MYYARGRGVMLSISIILIFLDHVALNVLAVNVAYCAIIFISKFLNLYADSMPCVSCVNCAVVWCLVACFALTVLTEFTVLTGLY